ncbi:MAG: glycine oxidase ThiO [Chthonomonadales bacterium]
MVYPDVVVVGGGIVGLSCAWVMARAGLHVTVVERGSMGCGATNASAGMLAPLSEAHEQGPFVDLGLASLARYPEFVRRLNEETGEHIASTCEGLMRVAMSPEEAAGLDDAARWQKAIGLPVERLTGDAARHLEPELSPEIVAATRTPQEQRYDPPDLTRGLVAACINRGVRLMEGTHALGLLTSGARVLAVQTPTEDLHAHSIVLATGAWTQTWASCLQVPLPVFPVKGQILAVHPGRAQGSSSPTLGHTIYSHHGYLVPRADGCILVGATSEPHVQHTHVTVAGVASLLEAGKRLMPGLGAATFEGAWAGLRPATPDGLPLIGPVARWQNVYVAAGHYRNGILLAPITADLVSGLILGEELPISLQPYLPARFLDGE